MISTTKSHRGVKDRDLIRFGQEEAHIRTVLIKNDLDYKVDMHLRKSRTKGIAINGQRIRKASELIGLLHIVFFSPEDLSIVKDGPAQRRRFMDMELCQLDASYLHDLNHYNKIIEQRNKLLKDVWQLPQLADTLDVWDDQLVSYGTRIIERRREFIEELAEIVGTIHGKLSGGREKLIISYEPNCGAEEMAAILKESRNKDIHLRMTSAGPHRDDFSFMGNDIDLRKFGSQGQQRTAALSIKLSEIYLVKKRIHDTPVLLLDDVLSELDLDRQRFLVSEIDEVQLFITSAELNEEVVSALRGGTLFRIEEGTVTRVDKY
jgi:DNA replication and repair protein RecF